MRRPIWSRALAALFALWFTVYTVEPVALHACDVHDAPRGAAAATMQSADMHAGHSVATTDDGEPSGKTSCCTCPGDCATTSLTVLPTTATVVSVVTTATTDSGLPDYEYVPVAAAHVLPFANGPPTRA
jgi:hypothetical protein